MISQLHLFKIISGLCLFLGGGRAGHDLKEGACSLRPSQIIIGEVLSHTASFGKQERRSSECFSQGKGQM